jgi:autotransporter-associated beta strand protein
MLHIQSPLRRISAGLGLALSFLAYQAGAQTQQWWDNNGASAANSGTWDTTTANWAPSATLTASTAAFGNGNFAIFAGGSTTISALTISVPGAVTCEGIGDGTTDTAGLSGSPVTSLTFSGTGSINLPSGTWSIECGVSANTITINIPITGSGGIAQHNSGTLDLYGVNTYSGGTSATGGQNIYYNNNASFGTGPISTAGGSTSFFTPNASNVTLANAFNINSGTTILNFADGNTICSGPWTLGVTPQLKNNHATQPLTISGAISGAFGLELQNDNAAAVGAGTITLSGANTYSGQTSLGAGAVGGITTLSVSSINSVTTPAQQPSSSLGVPSSVANGTISIGNTSYGCALVYTGAGETSDRVINLAGTTGTAYIEMDGAGPLVLTKPFTATGAGAKTLTLQGSSTAANTIGGAIVNSSSATSLTKAQAGTWVLSGVNTFTGNTTISGGTLTIGGAGSLGNGSYAGTIANSGAFIYNSSVAQTLSGVISGAGVLAQNGAGNLTLSATETFTGGTSIGVGSALIIGSGIITAAGKLTNNGAFYYNSTTAGSISGVISGSGTMNLNGTGGLTLGGANSYTGITAVTNGLLAISSDGNLGAVPGSVVANSITLNSGTTGANYGLRVAGNMTLNANRGIALGASGAAIQVAGGDTLAYNGIISGGPNFSMGPNYNTGSGTLILGGYNTYAGTTTIACGVLQLGASGALPSGTPLVVGASTSGTGIFNLTNFNQTIGPLSSSPGINGTGTTTPTIELGNSGALTINETSSTTFAGAITGGSTGGSVTLNAVGGALTLSGTNTYSCPTLINSGELIGVVGGSVSNSAVTVASAATNSILVTNNVNQWSCGSLTFNAGTAVLDFNFGSSVVPSATAPPLNVLGAAVFTGTPIVTVEAGNIPAGVGAYPLMTWNSASGTPPTTATLPPYVTGSLVVSANTLYLSVTNPQPIRWTGAAGNGLWDINTSVNWDDVTGTATDYQQATVPGEAVILDETYISASPAITLNTTVSPASVTVSNTIYNYTISGTGGIGGSIGLTKLGSGTLTLACANTYTGRTTNLSGTLIVGADANLGTAPASATVSSIVLSNSILSATNTFILNANRGITMLVNSSLDVAGGNQVNYTGIIAGTANLTKTSPGTLVLGGNNNSYSGNTIITAGVLQTGGDHTTGATASNLGLTPSTYAPTNITLAGGILQGNNANFSFNTNRGIVLLANSGLGSTNGCIMGIPGNIIGNYGLTISNLGSGVVYLTGTNTYTGGTLIVTGLLSLQAGGSLSNSSLSIAAGAGFDVSRLANSSYVMGGGSFAASGNGTVTNLGTANAALIDGASGGTVSLGSLPIFLTYTPANFTGDATNPSLYVSQGTLQLNGNTFTLTNASGTPLGAGTYVLIQQNGGSINNSGSCPVTVTGSGVVAGNTASISVAGATANLVVTWQPPTIAIPTLTTNVPAGLLWKIAIANLASAAGWGDPEGQAVTLSSVGSSSTNGVSLTSDANYIYYNGAVSVPDQFAYTVTDGTKTAGGTVVPVSVASPSIASTNITVNVSGNPTFGGFGIPGYVYGVESGTNVLGPWIEAGTTTVSTASTNEGAWNFTDLSQTNPPTIFYRLYYPDNSSNPPQ